MPKGASGFFGVRLREARVALGLTQSALAHMLDLKNSAPISKWEKGERVPSEETLKRIADALCLPVHFFFRPPPERKAEHPVFFRSLASATKGMRDALEVRLQWLQEISLTLQKDVEFPAVRLPDAQVQDYRKLEDTDIERMAAACRRIWGLGRAPVPHLIDAMEVAGIVVAKVEVGTAKLDGLSTWCEMDRRPYVVLASDKETCVRSRMDAAHELGHLILHRHVRKEDFAKGFKEIERQAFLFASAFLLPAEPFSNELWYPPTLEHLLELKRRWKVSVGAMIKRCRELGIIGEYDERRLWRQLSARGWRKKEPLDDELLPEKPSLLARAVKLLIEEEIYTRQELIGMLGLHRRNIEGLCSLPSGYLKEPAEVVRLTPSANSAPKLRPVKGAAEIIRFEKK